MCRLLLMTIALLAILFGISGLYMMPKLIQRKIEERMQLKIGTKNFDRFTRVPIPIKVKFYFFNVTNTEQVLAGLERPRFEEVGPFMYEQWRRRSIVDIIDNNRKITYKEYKTFYSMWPAPQVNATAAPIDSMKFKYLDASDDEPEGVGGSQEGSPRDSGRPFILNPYLHNVTIVNLPLLSMLTKLADLEDGSLKRNIAVKIVSRLIREGHEQMLVNRRVNELLFDGYKVGVMEAARDLVSTTLGFNFESPLPRNKFGFFHGKNNTWKRDEAGEMTIYTGRNDSMNDFMLVDNWNGLHQLNTWPRNTEAGDRCNEIRGTDGSQFHPGVTRDHVLGIFSPMICTSIQVKYKEDTSCRDIPLLRFTTTADMFAAPKKLARNACYCAIKDPASQAPQLEYAHRLLAAASGNPSNLGSIAQEAAAVAASVAATANPAANSARGATNGAGGANGKARITNSRCYIDGLMDLSLCQKGAPVAASSPHFYNGDPMLAMAAGLRPNKTLHETHMDIEPMTGAVMRAASRAQLNAFVERAALEVVEPELIGHMTPMVAPLLWFEESAEIDERSSADFKRQLLDTVHKARRSFFLAVAFGVLLALVVSLQYWYVTCYKLDTVSLKARKRREAAAAAAAAAELKTSRRSRSRSPGAGAVGRGGVHAARRQQQRAVGARKSNLAQMNLAAPKRPLVELADHDAEDEGVARAAGAAIAVAAALGAADAQATRNQRKQRRQLEQQQQATSGGSGGGGGGGGRNRLRRSAAMDAEGLAGRAPIACLEADEDELSRRGLVENEWGAPEAGTTASSSGGTSNGLDPLEPSTSDGLLGGDRDDDDDGRPMRSRASSFYSDD